MPDGNWENRVYIGIGSNIEPELNVPFALELLACETRLLAISTFYRTAPLGRPEQPEFLNGVCRVETRLEPRRLKFDVLRSIEERLGRTRGADRCAARTMDLDILVYGDTVCDESDLQIPDPDIRERAFVLIPLMELMPEAVLPGTGEVLKELPAASAAATLRPDLPFSRKLQARFVG